MKQIVKHCRLCEKNPIQYREYFNKIFKENGFPDDFVDLGVVGYYTINENDNRDFCQVHPNEKLIISPLSSEEYNAITCITNDLSFIHAMEKLKNSDPIEYQLKLSQFKANLSQTKAVEENNVPKCPYCHSTNIKKITNTSKVVNTALFGIFGQKRKHQWHCNNCNSDF